jgi:molybdopterin converting factor small subunit
MKVKVRLSSLLRHFGELTSEPDAIEVSAPSALECLQDLVHRFPSIRQYVYDKEGKLQPFIMFFVNGEKLLANEFTRPLKDGDELFVLLAFAGG